MTIGGISGIGQTAATKADLERKKLVDAAQEFEGMMLEQMLKPMTSSDEKGGEGGGFGVGGEGADDSVNTWSGFGTAAVAKAISKSGGLGIARQVVAQVTRQQDRSDRPLAALPKLQ